MISYIMNGIFMGFINDILYSIVENPIDYGDGIMGDMGFSWGFP